LLILCLVALTPGLAPAAVTGRLQSIGFNSFIRQNCWIPITVQTNSDLNEPHTFDLQIVQSDLDGDNVVYTRPVTVNPGTQTFWACFKPDPTEGIPAVGTVNAADFAKRLKIYLSEPAGPTSDPAFDKHVVQIATAGNLPQALEAGNLQSNRGQKLMLFVGRMPQMNEFDPSAPRVIGMAEDIMYVRVEPNALPFDALGYEAVDAVVWTDADIERLDPAQLRALRQYVRAGGRLVVIQNVETQRMGRLDEFLPVHVNSIESVNSQEPLRSILMPGDARPLDQNGNEIDPWRRIGNTFSIAKATATPDAVVDTWTTWPDKSRTPFIARRLFGNGCVSWIAQDISDPNITLETFGWPRVWQRIMDWRDVELDLTSAMTKNQLDKAKQKFEENTPKDIGYSFKGNIDQNSTTAAYISVAFVFFIAYWCIAGPGSYFLLAAQRRATWSWFVFGGLAVLATLLSVGITTLLLRGGAKVAHESLVRLRGDGTEPAYVRTHFSIYLPRDERAAIALTDRDTTALPAAITPLVIDPKYNGYQKVDERDSRYAIPVEADDAGEVTRIDVPFRSTLKRLQADWAGSSNGRINGSVKFSPDGGSLVGQLSNNTGQTLTNVVMVFRRPGVPSQSMALDQVLALREWKNGLTLDLAKEWANAESRPIQLSSGNGGIQLFGLDKPRRGSWQWAVNWLYEDFRHSSMGMNTGVPMDDSGSGYGRSFVLASLFDRCWPLANPGNEHVRVDIKRFGVRQWDCSGAVAAGALVVLGQADSPIPLPLTIDGDPPVGGGHTFFQGIIPIDQTGFNTPDKAADER